MNTHCETLFMHSWKKPEVEKEKLREYKNGIINKQPISI